MSLEIPIAAKYLPTNPIQNGKTQDDYEYIQLWSNNE